MSLWAHRNALSGFKVGLHFSLHVLVLLPSCDGATVHKHISGTDQSGLLFLTFDKNNYFEMIFIGFSFSEKHLNTKLH